MKKEKQSGLHKKRMANIELLRLLAMMMVVSLHYLGKGELLPELTGKLSARGHLAWILESFSIAAVDVYVLISGYFLVETGFRCRRIISLILQVMFYACLIPVILILAGVLPVEEITVYTILQYIFPVNMLHYWFVSAYVLMFLFTPVLNAAVHTMKKRQLEAAIIILLLMESLSKTVIPVRLEMDNLGYDACWFIVVYLIAAYCRLYGIPFLEKEKTGKNRAPFFYAVLCISIYGLTMLIRMAFLKTGRFEDFIKSAYGYNHLLTIGAALALFYAFRNWRFGETGLSAKLAPVICKAAPCSFGVYLLHEHINLRYKWPFWLGAKECGTPGALLWHWIVAILTVMAAGLFIDGVREILFRASGSLFSGSRLERILKSVDDRINGIEYDGRETEKE